MPSTTLWVAQRQREPSLWVPSASQGCSCLQFDAVFRNNPVRLCLAPMTEHGQSCHKRRRSGQIIWNADLQIGTTKREVYS